MSRAGGPNSKHSGALARLRKEFAKLQREPHEGLEASPLDSNLLEWHYVIAGPPDTPFAGGQYHGKLVFPPDYPYRPPAVYMLTPSGRFQTNTRLCLSMSDFHPETWNPLWSVSSIVSGVRSFMADTKEQTYGSIAHCSDAQRVQYARDSRTVNRRNGVFQSLFPHLLTDGAVPGAPPKAAATAAAAGAAATATAPAPGVVASATATTVSDASGDVKKRPTATPAHAAPGASAAAAPSTTRPATSATTATAKLATQQRQQQQQQQDGRNDVGVDRLIIALVLITLLFGLSLLYR